MFCWFYKGLLYFSNLKFLQPHFKVFVWIKMWSALGCGGISLPIGWYLKD